MAEEENKQILILACSCVILSSALVFYAAKKQKRRHTVSVHGYLKECNGYGAYNCLVKNLRQLRQHDIDKLWNYLRMELPVLIWRIVLRSGAMYYVSVHKI